MIVIDSATWTGRHPKPMPRTEPPQQHVPSLAETLARIANEHGTDFASRVAASINSTGVLDR